MQAASPIAVHDPPSPRIFAEANNIYTGPNTINTNDTNPEMETLINADLNNVLENNMNTDVTADITNFDVYMNNDLQYSITSERAANNNNAASTTASSTSYSLLTSLDASFTTADCSFRASSTDRRASVNSYTSSYNENCNTAYVTEVNKKYDRGSTKDIDVATNGTLDVNNNDSNKAQNDTQTESDGVSEQDNDKSNHGSHDEHDDNNEKDNEDNDTSDNCANDDADDNGCQARDCANQDSGWQNHNNRADEQNNENQQLMSRRILAAETPLPNRASRKRKPSEELETTQGEKRAKFLERNRQAGKLFSIPLCRCFI
jgi:hypothetical protein